MLRRVARGLLVVMMMVGGVTVVAEAPALAAVGACRDSDPVLTPCVNWGDSGQTQLRADFYFKRRPDPAYYTYYVYLVVNGDSDFEGSGRIDHQGRYCCWYRTVNNLPAITVRAYTRVVIYRSDGVYHYGQNSPTITFRA